MKELEEQSIYGFVPVARSSFEHDLWREQREFSRYEAWLWLISNARYSQSITTKLIKLTTIKWGRGQLAGAESFLQKAWGWKSRHKVRNFLTYLRNEGMITTDNSQGLTIITLINFEKYNKIGKESEQCREQVNNYPASDCGDARISRGHQRDIDGTLTEHLRDINCNKDNNGKKANKEILGGGETLPSTPKLTIPKPTVEERIEKFTKEVNEFTDFDVGMREGFIEYWTEPNKNKSKLRFEDQKFFDIKRRLITWRTRDGQRQFTGADRKRFAKDDPMDW